MKFGSLIFDEVSFYKNWKNIFINIYKLMLWYIYFWEEATSEGNMKKIQWKFCFRCPLDGTNFCEQNWMLSMLETAIAITSFNIKKSAPWPWNFSWSARVWFYSFKTCILILNSSLKCLFYFIGVYIKEKMAIL